MSLRPTARSSSICQDQGELIFCKSLPFLFTKVDCSIFALSVVSCSFFVIFSLWHFPFFLLLSPPHQVTPSSWTSFFFQKFKSICNVYSNLFICSSTFGWVDFQPYLNEIVRIMRKWKLSGNKIPLRRKWVAEAGARLAAPRLLRLLVRVEESGEGNDFIFLSLSFFLASCFWCSWRILLLEGEGKILYFHGFLV